jgi:arylsulfatase A-like enzyme
VKNEHTRWQIWRLHLIIALLVGLGLGVLVGWAEGIGVLESQHLFGRYDELVPWAIVFDAGALIVLGLSLACVSEFLFLITHQEPALEELFSFQLGTAVSAVVMGWIVASLNIDAQGYLANAARILLPTLAAGLLAGGIGYALARRITARRALARALNPRTWLAGEVIILVAAVGWSLMPRVSDAPAATTLDNPGSATRYNVLIVTIDTLREDSIGLDGNATVKTPNLDRLGHSGTWFTHAIVQQPNTNASHTSIFTGVFPFVHGVRQHMIDLLSPNVQTLAEILDQQGYQTAGLYSWVSLEPGFSGLRGFQTYEDLSVNLVPVLRDPRFDSLIVTYRLLGKYLYLPGLIENQLLKSSQDSVEDTADGKANVTTDGALRWLDANADSGKPFFLWVHYYDPHYPYTPPPPFDTMYDPNYTGTVDGSMTTINYIYSHGTGNLTDADVHHLQALYDGEISFTDQQLGRLLDELDRLGLSDHTILVVTGDHGESLGTLGRWFHGSRLNYTDIHVPLIIRFPPAIPANHSIAAPVESIDIMPTILDLLHMPAPAIVQGKSLVPLINGATSQVHPGAITMLDTYSQFSLVTNDWHLIWNQQSHTPALYDYHADPLETNDLASQHPDVVGQLYEQLQQQLVELKFPNP